jgi:hypothetical protein
VITRRSLIRAAPLVALLGLAGTVPAQTVSSAKVPDTIKAPAGEQLILRAHAAGVQIYVCGLDADGKTQKWALKAPEAELRDGHGAVIGHHSAGPSWKHKDGSEITGKAAAKADSPDPQAIPWLLITVTGHSGEGVFARVTSVQRIHTHGGKAPEASSCDPAKEKDSEVRVPYRADYYFYAPASRSARP